jgi:exodeoxyribonuclease VII small subunit
MTEQSESFKENYATLKQVAETLRNQQEPDIDALIPMVD